MNKSDIQTVRENIKKACKEHLQSMMFMSLANDMDGAQQLLQEKLRDSLENLESLQQRNLTDVEIKRTKLPRKLKKRHKKENIIDMTVKYREVIPTLSLTVVVDKNETKIEI